MEIKTLPPINVLYYSTETTLKDLGQYVFNVAKQLYTECCKTHILPTGPVYWVYYGADGNPDKVFTLEIALPVNHPPIASSLFKFKQLPAFKCIEAVHYGNWNELHTTYAQVVPALLAEGHTLSNCSREMYVNIDLTHPQNNITTLQIGVL